jgi:hypothetical protein
MSGVVAAKLTELMTQKLASKIYNVVLANVRQ